MTPKGDSKDARRHLEDIQRVIDASFARMGTRDLLNELLDRVREILDVDTAAVLLTDPSGERLVAVASQGLEEEVRQGVQIPMGKGFAGRIAARREPVFLERVDHDNVLNPILLEKGVTSMLGVPLLVGGRAIGVLHVGSLQSRIFDQSDAALLQMVAERISLAIHARQSADYRAASETLQRYLLPAGLPVIGGLEIAARYAPGDGDVGGDWYDVFELPSGDVALIIGDVAGKGLDAAVVMARARSVVRAYALASSDPVDVLNHLHQMLLFFERTQFLTVFFGVLSPSSGAMRYSSAGHLMPVLATPDGRAEALEGEADFPVGLMDVKERRAYQTEIPPGSTLYLFTDGLVERRDRPLDEGLTALKRSALSGDPEWGCVSILRATVGDRVLDDDLALLGVHRVDPAQR